MKTENVISKSNEGEKTAGRLPAETRIKKFARFLSFSIIVISMLPLSISGAGALAQCERTITADVVALDQPFFYNRLGAWNPAGMIYALRRDVVDASGVPLTDGGAAVPGAVSLRPDKRPRPIVLRMNVGDCLEINFTNLLAPDPIGDQPATRNASIHVLGMQLVNNISDDGSNVGTNPDSLVAPGGNAKYTIFAERENTYLLYSTGATTGGEGDGGSLAFGLFGAINVEPRGAEWYRSQLTAAELQLATTGTTPDGQPIINYDSVYPNTEPFKSEGKAGLPIIRMTRDVGGIEEIVHSDINAIITGPNRDNFPKGTYLPNPVNVPLKSDEKRSRNEPFREFTVIFHDEIFALQAFPQFQDPVLEHTLHGVRDGFAINYGAGGAGAEILANRLGVGPMFDCVECKYEEFFLTSWAVGDPAMVVDIPANAVDKSGKLIPGPKATRTLYPDDPSNVFPSYIGDHVKIRNLHAGPKEHHLFHLHAQQWLFTPDSDNSTYLDGQMVGPGSGYTYEIAYNGAGNRNKQVGDAIFHCHFYPHFAQGMWALWRIQDVFESGTALDEDGNPTPGSRAYPDAEIKNGTPIPATVPIPGRPMAPMPGAQVQIINGQINITPLPDKGEIGNPGYPFFIPGLAGHRPPKPPLDTLDDGGLPRHIIVSGEADSVQNRLDFSKELRKATAIALPEEGTPAELAAMAYHSNRTHQSFRTDGTPAYFFTNGRPPVPGAPYADPCVDDYGKAAGAPRNYSAAVIQLDLVMNKVGWHFPQSRIITLWGDVNATLNGTRPPEPFFFRANTNDCINFNHTNLVPKEYELDDYQVRTPTDIIGQHIHLVKFDVTSSDGSANGWNYEDGTFSPGEVIERIDAIKAAGGSWIPVQGGPNREDLEPRPHPFFGESIGGLSALGAQTTIQRWYADNVLNNRGEDRTLRTAFSHDHFSPSTAQQTGLYASLLVEPEKSTWRNSETGEILGTRFDGGPTSWRADILTKDKKNSYREFAFQFADFQPAYKAGGGLDENGNPIPDPENVINPPAREEVGLPFLLARPDKCPGGVPLPCPEAISADDIGTMTVNYRNEPVALRVLNAATSTQASGPAGDLSFAFQSRTDRAIPQLNTQFGDTPYPPLTAGVQPGDPFTPILRAYENDSVQIRIQVGAHEEGHNTNIHGIRWLQEPSDPNSGYRNSQAMGIDDHFEFVVPPLSAVKGNTPFADYMYQTGSASDDLWNGLWGIMRAYNGGTGLQPDLLTLPSNPGGKAPPNRNPRDFSGVCPRNAPSRKLSITAVTAQQVLPGGTLVYNNRTENGGALNDPTAILYINTRDIDKKTGKLKPGVPVEPLILRANAGDCIDVTLTNNLPETLPDLAGFSTLPMIVENFNANQVAPSNQVGLHPQLLEYDITSSDGANAGFNDVQTVGPGGVAKYRWYAGKITVNPDGTRVATPVEFGATNLISSDPIKHSSKGAIGALIIEPQGSNWTEDADSRASATVTLPDGTGFREFVLLFQDDVNLRFGSDVTLPFSKTISRMFAAGDAVPNLAEEEDPEDSGQKALNYRTEPIWKRMGFAPDADLEFTRTFDFSNALSNAQVGGDPVTPVFTARAGTQVRFRILEPGGHARNHVFQVHGHIWEREPYTNNSTKIGDNPLSQWIGAQEGHGPSDHFDIVLKNGAGGAFNVTGDYLYRNQASFAFDGGQWGILRVTP
ncbi:hypothetical protein ANME2D_00649 [Candidatus Methanoperedens nitroreducens]|uniref:Multicopper oxidase n=1 Tax=Candidatus Methanoperedens nitratireducens TaxID=1392998 RepID=A0A062VAP4_9EURY|nr:hypothetical protein [Candidatus Methanoperedens nitroreducens]KCZ73578.1 hypothetical protein ANME2D_00649 [Candidatus Methanoperedens nitroreducens]MDJ1422462.1 hypothetical protein [Candidatus Methanoperedens sp.]